VSDNMIESNLTVTISTFVASLAFATMMLAAPLATAAQTSSWYLMAPNEKIVSNPRVVIRMEHGPVMGPLEFMVRGQFSSRAECEPERRRLITEWRQLSVIKRGSWNKYGFHNPGIFVRCVPSNDPQLRKSEGAEGSPTMETFINRPSYR
jgi:hypothetical protein